MFAAGVRQIETDARVRPIADLPRAATNDVFYLQVSGNEEARFDTPTLCATQKAMFFRARRDRLCRMRKLTRRDWLALSAPAVMSILVAYFHGHQKGRAAGAATGAAMFAFTVWTWRRRIIKYPENTWKVRL
ncbi:hypothetical protein [Sphingosinicella sp. BN140058]|uniref:hypothetical protein n=1 Tax=Sphingosinicella sp. BN140058 TaxID=1892855 RepID=UPI0010103F7E|nr:hypothetical protein [Sphingosinicella sp. BN140058]QAY75609.1 hypothetical protein ETR14_03000 [Sphingosinicella sp. BN140058]